MENHEEVWSMNKMLDSCTVGDLICKEIIE